MSPQEVGEELRKINEQLSSMNKHLFVGNGRPSLMERVRVIEEAQVNCPARAQLKARFDKASVIIAAISVVIAIWSAAK